MRGKIVRIVAVLLLSFTLAGCGSMSEIIADSLPHWAGGLPPDTPPRPNDPKYDKFIQGIKDRAIQPDQQVEKSENQVQQQMKGH